MFTGKERDAESGLDYFGARYYGSSMGRFMSPDFSDDPMPIPFTDPGNPQTLNAYAYGINNPLTNSDASGHDVNVCTNDQYGNQQCTLMSNDQYSAATQGNGSLNVPSLNSVGMNGSGNITDADGNAVGTATYVSNGGFDYYGNQSFYNTLGTTGATMNNWTTYAGWYGASAVGGFGAYASGLTAMGGVEANSVVGPAALRNILAKVTDQRLRNIVGDLYRVTATIGDGGTADAITYTKETGELVGGSDHIMKGEQYVRALSRVINSGRLTEAEKGIAQYLQNALKSALGK
jgi:RHS repeat-associated protein